MFKPSEYLIVDIATTAIAGADAYVEEPSAPSNYRDEAKIAAYIAEAKAKAIDKCALDADLGRVTAIGVGGYDFMSIELCRDEDAERVQLEWLAEEIRAKSIVTFNGSKFDLPFLVRRALYLGVDLQIDLDRYRSPHVDLYEILTNRGQFGGHSLGFYVKRMGWTDLTKVLSGAEEARVPETGQWLELQQSVAHDLIATRRMATWMRLIPEPVRETREAVA